MKAPGHSLNGYFCAPECVIAAAVSDGFFCNRPEVASSTRKVIRIGSTFDMQLLIKKHCCAALSA